MRLYEFDDDGRLESIAQRGHRRAPPRRLAAARRHCAPRSTRKSVTQTDASPRSAGSPSSTTPRWPPASTQPRYLPSGDLRSSIEYRKRNGAGCQRVRGASTGAAGSIRSTCWRCAWRRCRSRSARCAAAALGKRLFLGIVFALGFWLLQTQFVQAGRRVQVRLPPGVPAAAGGDAGGVGDACSGGG